jgi:acetylornithine deacetylase/succinyl-diaminopimelate desuccinylase-like protein
MSDPFTLYLETNRDRFLNELVELTARPSIAAQGVGLVETAVTVQKRLERLGAGVRLITVEDAPPVIYAELGDRGPLLMIYNHYDVQPPEPLEPWDSPPFEPTIRCGRLYARGVADNKGSLLGRIQAAEAWLAVHGDLPLRLRWIIEGEEETSSAHLEAFVDENEGLVRGADGCLWESGYRDEAGRPVLTMGLKGIAYIELRARGAKGDLHSAYGPIIPNPVWRLTWALASLKNERDEITIDGYLDHVAEPPQEALEAADSVPFEEALIKKDCEIEAFINGVTGKEAVRRYLFAPTCTICGIDGGYTGEGPKTVLPSTARAKVDFRLVPNLTPSLAERLLREHLDRRGFSDIEIVMLGGEPPARSSVTSKVALAARSAAEKIYGMPPVVYPNMAGSGPMYHLCDRFGIPAVGTGCGDSLSNVHAPNESIAIDDYFGHIRFMEELINRFKE